MRKIILGVAISLDGYIEGPNGEYDWCFTDQDYGMTEFLNRIDTIFYGRKSFDMMMAAGQGDSNPFAAMKQYVFTTSTSLTYKDATCISGDIKNEIIRIKESKGKDIWLFGGASLTRSLLNEGLVDELSLAVHPILLGNGKLCFSGLHNRVKTKLLNTQTYSTGLVGLTYAIER